MHARSDDYDPDQINRALAELGPFAVLERLGVPHRREGRGAVFACLWHDERTPSATLALGARDLRAHCFGCQHNADGVGTVARARGIDVARDYRAALEAAAQVAGVGPVTPGSAAPRGPTYLRLAEPVEPPLRPDRGQLEALWRDTMPASDRPDVREALEARGLSPELVAALDLARALDPELPPLAPWARTSGRRWAEAGYALLLPAYAPADGAPRLEMRSLRAWCVDPGRPDHLPKRAAPAGMHTAGLVLADPQARRIIERGEPARFVVAEGEPDYLSLAAVAAQAERGWGVLGVVAGSWTQAVADLVPAGSVVAVATHDDPAGHGYAHKVAESARDRFDVVRAPPPGGGDLNDLHRAGALEAFDPFAGSRAPGSPPAFETELGGALGDFVTGLRAGRPALEPIPTGLRDLDDLLGGGFRPGDLSVLAGRTSQGKSACAFSVVAAHLTGPDPRGVMVFSVETRTPDAVARLLARQSRLPLSRLRRAEPASEAELAAVLAAAAPLAVPPCRLVESRFTAEEIAGRVAAYNAQLRRGGRRLGVVVVDYVQRVRKSNPRATEREHVMHVCAELKALAVAEDLAVLALSQVSRAVEARDDKRPGLSDLKESGSLEEDADSVIGVFRPGYYDESADPSAAELIVMKNRHGVVGKVLVRWRGETASYHDAEW